MLSECSEGSGGSGGEAEREEVSRERWLSNSVIEATEGSGGSSGGEWTAAGLISEG